jgi:hypothetical protein
MAVFKGNSIVLALSEPPQIFLDLWPDIKMSRFWDTFAQVIWRNRIFSPKNMSPLIGLSFQPLYSLTTLPIHPLSILNKNWWREDDVGRYILVLSPLIGRRFGPQYSQQIFKRVYVATYHRCLHWKRTHFQSGTGISHRHRHHQSCQSGIQNF